MSDMQILLISAGVVLIVLVLLYNSWQDWRARRSMRRALPETDQDVLMQDSASRREPGLWADDPPPAAAAVSVASVAVVTAAAGTGPDSAGAGSAVVEPVDEAPAIDPACEAVIDIALAHPVPGESLADALGAIVRVGKKTVRVFAEREGGGYRAKVREGEAYVALHLAVVLANRSGPLTAIEWSNLWTLAQNLAERFEGLIEAPDQEAVQRQAAELDARCAAMDAQVGLILQLSQPRPLAAILEAARGVGFVPLRGLWAWLSENGLPRFILQVDARGDEPSHRVDLVLDVPNSLPDDQAFSRMVAVGRDLAARLDAHLLDDQGRTFQDSSAGAIDQQISALYDRLDQAGFLAGTERAARVFS